MIKWLKSLFKGKKKEQVLVICGHLSELSDVKEIEGTFLVDYAGSRVMYPRGKTSHPTIVRVPVTDKMKEFYYSEEEEG